MPTHADEQPTSVTDDPCVENFNEDTLVAQSPSFISQLGMNDAWQLSQGGVLVAVVDSGVDASNPHFAGGVVLEGKDFVGQTDGRTDLSGHGTAVAGQISARQVEGSGVVGMAPASRILPVRVYENSTSEAIKAGKGPDSRVTAEGIRWAADQGAVVIAVPASSTSTLPELEEAVRYATDKGALVVASAGNASGQNQGDANTLRYPAAYPQVLSVTAVDVNGLPSDSVVTGEHIEVAAPGSNVLTTYKSYGDCILAADSPTTSYATGYAAALAALIASTYPSETPQEWEYRILATALRPNAAQKSNRLGWGIIAPYDALNFTNDGKTLGPENPKFPAPSKIAEPLMVRPEPTVDRTGAKRQVIFAITGAGAAAVAGIILASWIRQRRSAAAGKNR
ncbi:S8 family serine peptidase [Schaalia vaccimaxillae]|uniref:S8 family serine peptidase n=1 Tax=Schaalia vaccimaxillae TaxID=183916 RepID=UPI0013F4792F|nr:S8 family serine peptidase [Schaalia vaccimaxillae]